VEISDALPGADLVRGISDALSLRRLATNDRPSRMTYEDLVAGWQRADGSRWGRPVDVMVYRDGSVLVSDDLANADSGQRSSDITF